MYIYIYICILPHAGQNFKTPHLQGSTPRLLNRLWRFVLLDFRTWGLRPCQFSRGLGDAAPGFARKIRLIFELRALCRYGMSQIPPTLLKLLTAVYQWSGFPTELRVGSPLCACTPYSFGPFDTILACESALAPAVAISSPSPQMLQVFCFNVNCMSAVKVEPRIHAPI